MSELEKLVSRVEALMPERPEAVDVRESDGYVELVVVFPLRCVSFEKLSAAVERLRELGFERFDIEARETIVLRAYGRRSRVLGSGGSVPRARGRRGGRGVFVCPFCGAIFSSAERWQLHVSSCSARWRNPWLPPWERR